MQDLDKYDTLEVVLQKKNEGFKPHVVGLLYDDQSKKVLSQEAVLISPLRSGSSISSFLKKLDLKVPNHGLTLCKTLRAPVLAQSLTAVVVRGIVQDIALTIVGLRCKNLHLLEERSVRNLHVLSVKDSQIELARLGDLPQHLWFTYNRALQELAIQMKSG